MKYISIALLILLLFSCTRNNHRSNKIAHNNSGIYLPEYYIDALFKTRSHIRAFYKSSRPPNSDNNIAIIIYEDGAMFIYSFHEGVERDFIGFNEKEFIMEQRFENDKTKLFILDDYTIENEDGIVFINISKKTDNRDFEIKSCLTSVIFGDKVYRNEVDAEIYRYENGNIFIGGTEYELVLDTVFYHKEYDVLLNKTENKWNYVFFRMDNDLMNIYELKVPGDGPTMYIDGEYVLIDKFSNN
jgi:hypothetical protein